MPVAWPQLFNLSDLANTSIPTTTETIVATIPGVSTDGPGRTIRLQGWGQVLTGAGTTDVRVRIRRGSTVAGTQVGDAVSITATAATTREFLMAALDSPGEVASQPYVLTVAQLGATGNGTIQQVLFTADVCN